MTKLYISFFLTLLMHTALCAQDFYKPGVQEMKLELPVAGWHNQLDSLKRVNPEARMAGTALLNGQRFDSVGIRYKGNSSFFRTSKQTLKKLPFNIKVDYRKKGQHFGEAYTSIKLSNAFLDPSFVRDPLGYEIVSNYMPAPKCNFVRLTVNNEPYGLYVNTESVDMAFLKKHFGYNGGHLIKCDPDQWQKVRSQSGCPKGENASLTYLNENSGCYSAFYEVDDASAWKYLINMIKILNKKPAEIETVLNVDQTLWMLALNNALVNLDSYNGLLSHNYYLWFDSTGVGHPLIWDLNMCFGGWRRNLSLEEMTDEQLIGYQPLAELDNSRRPLISQLLKNSYYRKIYLAHLKTINTDWLASGKVNQRAEALMKEIDSYVQQDKQKLYSYEDFKNAMDKTMTDEKDHIIGIRQLMSKRAEYLSKHPLLNKTAPVLEGQTAQKQEGKTVLTIKASAGTTGVYAHYRVDRMFAFKRVKMFDDGTNGDATAADGIFTATVEVPFAQYYFSAENADAGVTLPERASQEYFKL
jgi:spore coat protein CotH